MTIKTQFFAGLKEQSEIKKRFHQLVKEHHPDRGGDTATMQEINNQYQEVMRGIYQAEDRNEGSVEWWMEQEAMLADKIAELLSLDGIEVELMGVWIWITGETKKHKDTLKDKDGIGARWAKDKKAWYWRSAEHAFYRKKAPSKSLDDLRDTFGSQKAKAKGTPRLTYTG